jgi:hypothetical protein
MKTIETILEQKTYDSKNILNRAANVTLSESVLNSIEDNGITSEQIDTLGVPVFKYQTQITIHGIFPPLEKSGRILGYKHIFQNKNMSLGVKYDAIDATKKRKIYNTISELSDFIIYHNSTEYYIHKYYRCESIEVARQKAIETQNEMNKIDKTLFFGNIGVNILKDMFGTLYVEKYIYVNAIYQKNVDPLIANVLNISIPEIAIKLQAKADAEAKAEEERKQAYEARKKAESEAMAPFVETAKNYLNELGYVKKDVSLYDGLVVITNVKINTEKSQIEYVFRKYTKTKQQKKFHYFEHSYFNVIPEIVDFKNQYSWSDYKTDRTKTNAYIKDVACENTKVENTEAKKPVNKTSESNIKFVDVKIVDYSEKSFVVIGNTKPIKETLKQLGGKFNMYLTCGCGWIFPNTKKEMVLSALK